MYRGGHLSKYKYVPIHEKKNVGESFYYCKQCTTLIPRRFVSQSVGAVSKGP